jgi:hypothetical protein
MATQANLSHEDSDAGVRISAQPGCPERLRERYGRRRLANAGEGEAVLGGEQLKVRALLPFETVGMKCWGFQPNS